MVIGKKLAFAVALTAFLTFVTASASAVTKQKHQSRPLTRAELKLAEQRLGDMGFWTGRVDGVIDGVTRVGLIAFQKWEGRRATGALTRSEFEAIVNATPPRPRDSEYRHVEVDLDRQILMMVGDDGSVARILPVSTGSGRHYNAKGMRGLAYTPRGRFRIYNKLSGWKRSPLGLLYYPNYFSDGLAIHGNPSVPRSPQSHGCVRIPMSAARDVSRDLSVGTIVLIYDNESFVSAKDWAEADKRKQAMNAQ